MQGKPIIRKIAALLLVFVLIQKTGMGLFLHNVLHASSAKASLPNDDDKSGVSYNCSCLDDFLAPFEESEIPFIAHPIIAHSSPVVFYITTDTHAFCITPSLRGPPADRLFI